MIIATKLMLKKFGHKTNYWKLQQAGIKENLHANLDLDLGKRKGYYLNK
jgi:hypothetical protein